MMFSDPSGLWPVYNENGEYIGDDGRNEKGKDLAFTGEKDGKGGFKNLKQFTDNHNKFIQKASTVYGESSAYKSEMTEDLRKEMFAIASVHERNTTAYGNNSAPAKKFRETSQEGRNGTKMQYAVAAEINALNGGFDYSYGADAWDGAEQAMFKSTDYRFSTGRFELHKNTLGWTISDAHYKQWSSNVGEGFEVPQLSFTPHSDTKYNKYYQAGRINLKSTAVYNKTIFWQTLKGKDVIKAYPWSIPNRPVEPSFLDNFKK
ncbi:hypothetical protein [Flavobacterium olei]|uniref:hypothetical protein n=1 Tax=Flavobacterium olei TaxID=1886782 RepID=UPI00321B7DF0